MKKYKSILFFLILAGVTPGFAQNTPEKQVDYRSFLQMLAQQNLEFAAEKYHVDISAAQVQAAKAFPDPQLSFAAHDNQERRLKTGYGFEAQLSWEIELGGKRKARKDLAAENYVLAQLELGEFFQKLRNESSRVFFKTLKIKREGEILVQSALRLEAAAQENGNASDREFLREAFKEIKAQQDRNAEQYSEALADLHDFVQDYLEPGGELEDFLNLTMPVHDEDLSTRLAHQRTQVAALKTQLAKAGRAPDLGVMVGVQNNAFVKNIIGPAPGYTMVTAGVNMPLKFSNKVEAESRTAELEEKKATLELRTIQRKRERAKLSAAENIQKLEHRLREETNSVKTAAEQLTAVRTANRTGNSAQLFFNAENKFREAQLSQAEALYEYIAANFAPTTALENNEKDAR